MTEPPPAQGSDTLGRTDRWSGRHPSVDAVLSEQNDEWAVGRRYMAMVTLLSPLTHELTSGQETLLQAAS